METSNKRIYVPVARRDKKQTERARLARETATEKAGAVFRSVAWSGASGGSADPPSAPRRWFQGIDVRLPAGSAFGQVPWTGIVAAAPTSAQASTSVRSILNGFQWE